MEYIKTAHSVYYLQYHIVWVCKYRRRILDPGLIGRIRKILPKLLRSMPGVKLETIGFEKDHLHMVMSIPLRYSIASVMGKLKSQSSWQIRKSFPWLAKVYWNENIVWSPGYFLSSVGVDEEKIIKYVELQGRQDSGQLQLKL